MEEDNNCGKCGAVIDNGLTVVCEGICNKKYHLTCSGIDEAAAGVVEANINVSFVCNLCTIFTPNGLYNKINDIFSYVQRSKTEEDMRHELIAKSQENLVSTIKVYLKEMIKENKSSRDAVKENNSQIIGFTKKLKFVEYKIDKIADETSSYQYPRVIQSFKDFDQTLDNMAEITTNIVESGLERQSKIVSQLNNTISDVLLSNRAIEEFAATTTDILQTNHQIDVLQQDQVIAGVEAKVDNVFKRFENRMKKDFQIVTKTKSTPAKRNHKKPVVNNKEENRKNSYKNDISEISKLPNGNLVISFGNEIPCDQPLTKSTKRTPNMKKKHIDFESDKKSVTFDDKVRSNNEKKITKRRSIPNSTHARSVEDTTTTYTTSKATKSTYVKVKIVGLSERLEEREMNQYLQEQNEFISYTSYTKILKYEEARNPHSSYHRYNAIVEMDKIIMEKCFQVGKVNINWDKCYVVELVEQIKVSRCFKCSGYNHRSDKCRNKTACPRCSGEHELVNCKNQDVQCINCLIFNNKLNLKLNTKHSALSKDCEVFKRKVQFKKESLSGSK